MNKAQLDSSPVDSRPQKIRCLHDVVMAASSQFWLDHLHTLEVLRFQIVSKSASHWIKTADHLEPLSIITLPSTQHCWSQPYAKYNALKDRDVVTDQALSCLWSICGDQIRSIELNFLNITGRGLKFLFDRSPHLHTISLTHCKNIDGATLMDNLLSSTLKSLRSVRLNGISLVENDLQRLCDRGVNSMDVFTCQRCSCVSKLQCQCTNILCQPSSRGLCADCSDTVICIECDASFCTPCMLGKDWGVAAEYRFAVCKGLNCSSSRCPKCTLDTINDPLSSLVFSDIKYCEDCGDDWCESCRFVSDCDTLNCNKSSCTSFGMDDESTCTVMFFCGMCYNSFCNGCVIKENIKRGEEMIMHVSPSCKKCGFWCCLGCAQAGFRKTDYCDCASNTQIGRPALTPTLTMYNYFELTWKVKEETEERKGYFERKRQRRLEEHEQKVALLIQILNCL